MPRKLSPSVTVTHEASEIEPQLLRVMEEGDEAVPPDPFHGEVPRELREILVGHFLEGLLSLGESAVGHLGMLPPLLIRLWVVFNNRSDGCFCGKESGTESSGSHGIGHSCGIPDQEGVSFDDLGNPTERYGPCTAYGVLFFLCVSVDGSGASSVPVREIPLVEVCVSLRHDEIEDSFLCFVIGMIFFDLQHDLRGGFEELFPNYGVSSVGSDEIFGTDVFGILQFQEISLIFFDGDDGISDELDSFSHCFAS